MIRDVSAGVHPCDNERTKNMPLLMCLNYCTVYMNWQKNRIKYSAGVRRLKKTTTIPMPEKNEPDRTGLVKSSQVKSSQVKSSQVKSGYSLF